MTRVYSAIVGATDGNIIAAIITTQMPRNQPRLPRLVQGPASMPRMTWTVQIHPTRATAHRAATSPSRARTAAAAGVEPAPPDPVADAIAVRRPR